MPWMKKMTTQGVEAAGILAGAEVVAGAKIVVVTAEAGAGVEATHDHGQGVEGHT